jgi:hypothetical protein
MYQDSLVGCDGDREPEGVSLDVMTAVVAVA